MFVTSDNILTKEYILQYTKEEKIKLISRVRDTVDVPIMAGTGSFNTQDSIDFTKEIV